MAGQADNEGSAGLGPIPLVGRDLELATVCAALTSGERRAFVLAGPPGVGKTRLAREVQESMAAAGYPTATVKATAAGASIPFGVFAPILSDIDVSSADGQLRLLQRACETILSPGQDGRPLVLVVDDGHLLDAGSATLVHQLAGQEGCRLVVTLRAGVPTPDPVTALWKDELANRLDLQPMNEEEVRQLAQAILGGPPDGRAMRWLWQQSAGNPLFARELILGALQTGDLVERNGIWVLRGSAAAPQRLAELIDARLGGLPEACSDIVDILAIAEPLEWSILVALTSIDAVEQAESLSLTTMSVSDRRSQVNLFHPLFAEVRRRQMPRTRLRRLSARVAKAVADTGAQRQDDLLRIATWTLDSGAKTDGELYRQAAAIARRRFARELAARLARAALDAGAGVEESLAVAEAEFFAGNHEAAEKILAETAPHCRDDREVMLIANARAYNFSFLMNDKVRALEVVDEALQSIVDPSSRLRLRLRQAGLQVYSEEFESALDSLGDALVADDATVSHRAFQLTAITLGLLGRNDEALATVRLGVEAQQRSPGLNQGPRAQMIGSIVALLGRGSWRDAEAEFRTSYDLVMETGDNESIATFALMGGLVMVEVGRLADGATLYREGAAINEEIADNAPLRYCLGGVAVAEGMAGRAAEAAAAIEQLDAVPDHWMVAFAPVTYERGRAWAMVARGETTAARTHLHAVTDRCASRHNRYAEGVLLHDLVRLGDAPAVADRLATLAEIVGGEAVPLYARHAQALAGSAIDDLEAVAEGFQVMGAALLAAEAASEVAALCRDQSLARRASTWDRTAAEWRKAVPDVVTPALRGAGGGDGARLTRREKEIADLAALGIPSREIAERLFLSVRTVESHLQRIYTKLGITKREHLADALGG